MKKQKYHLIAIGGIGMSALARILLQKGISITGSDTHGNDATKELELSGAKIFLGHAPSHVPEDATVVYSTAIQNDNPELCKAKERGQALIHRSALLNELMQGHAPLLIGGTHGKTTTSALLTHVLMRAGLFPSFAIGGVAHSLGVNGRFGRGPYFVAEACESDGSFLQYPAYGAIVTNIGTDHLDFWKSTSALEEGFRRFASAVRSSPCMLYCCDDEKLFAMGLEGTSYGFRKEADAWISHYTQNGWQIQFNLVFEGRTYYGIQANMIGRHNVLNAAAVFTLCLRLGVPEGVILAAFKDFQGVGRRVEKKGEVNGIVVYDDYGHHPTEIATTLYALKQALGDRRLIAVFQPHRYTRTRDCMQEFAKAFDSADLICLTDIYSAGENPIEGVTIEALQQCVARDKKGLVFYASRADLVQWLKEFVIPGDAIVTVGAGDVTKVGPEFLASLSPTYLS